MPSRRRFLVTAILLVVPLAHAQPSSELTVAAAASLTDVLREIGRLFEASHPNIPIRMTFGASGALLQQIAQGAPVDVFVSADEETVDRGIARKLLLPETRRDVAANTLVLAIPADRVRPSTVQELVDPSVRRIAIGKPETVPAGRYAQQALTKAGLWSQLTTRFVYADNVRQVLDYVSRGEVDAGLVYGTDARILRDRIRVAATVAGHSPIVYPAIVTADSRQRSAAVQFIDFLRSPTARERLAGAGFVVPD
jgi:molybdate transport system substrate-binding protein